MIDRRTPVGIAYVAQHPVQYHAPLYRRLAGRKDLAFHVYYCGPFGTTPSLDADFKTEFRWDVSLTVGYNHTTLRNISPLPFEGSRVYFWRALNPGIVLRAMRPSTDVVILHGYALATYWFAWAAAMAGRKKIILTGEAVPGGISTSIQDQIKNRALSFLCKHVDACVAIGTASRRFYLEHGVPDERMFLAPYAVDNDFFMTGSRLTESRRLSVRRELGIGPAERVTLFAGKLIEKKRPLDLLHAADASGIPQTVLFVGDGPLRARIETEARTLRRTRVVMAGFRNQSEMPRMYATADLFVLPSGPGETFGLALNEAMCAALPVIASDLVPGALDLVRKGVNGFTFPSGDRDRLAAALRKIHENPTRRKNMGSQSLSIIRNWNYEEAEKGFMSAVRFVMQRPTPKTRSPRPKT